MDLYTDVSYELSEKLTKRYSTSFSMSSRLFGLDIRRHIYAIYGMVRIADEIVDTFRMEDSERRLIDFQAEVHASIARQYSTNPVIHAFAHTANKFNIDKLLIDPFFDSMKTDLSKKTFTKNEYSAYIHGSAEVIGLMCLKVFVGGDEGDYEKLRDGASHLGAAYQKVNFLRDIAEDNNQLGRVYFPGVHYDDFSEDSKREIIEDIKRDFEEAKLSLDQLPNNSRRAVNMSYVYYLSLLDKIERTPAAKIKVERIRIPDWKKLYLLIMAQVKR